MVLSLPFFFFNDTATTEIYTLSLHDALPIFPASSCPSWKSWARAARSRSRGQCRTRCGRRRTSCGAPPRSEEHTSELQSHSDLVCRLLLEKKKKKRIKKKSKNEDNTMRSQKA